MKISHKIIWVVVFAVSFALVESAIVVYLRSLYYPEGFSLPLRIISRHHFWVELSRELATIIMLACVGVLTGSSRWQRFAYFMIAFGIWDIFYYVWLKLLLNWPASVFDWDVLFLLPVPWIGPVIAPAIISFLLIAGGWIILKSEQNGRPFHPSKVEWSLAVVGTAMILFSFVYDTDATLRLMRPQPFSYGLFAGGLACYFAGLISCIQKLNKNS